MWLHRGCVGVKVGMCGALGSWCTHVCSTGVAVLEMGRSYSGRARMGVVKLVLLGGRISGGPKNIYILSGISGYFSLGLVGQAAVSGLSVKITFSIQPVVLHSLLSCLGKQDLLLMYGYIQSR